MKAATIKLGDSLVIGSAFLVAASLGASGESSPRIPSDVQLAEAAAPRSEESAIITPSTKTVTITRERKWTQTAARRFATLALKRAKGQATQKENAEFEELQQARRNHYQESSIEFIEQWKQSKFRRELLEVLERNVHFLKPEDQARIRSGR